jgi:hypothetical protein
MRIPDFYPKRQSITEQAAQIREVLDKAGLTVTDLEISPDGVLVIPKGSLKFAVAAESVAGADPGNTQQVAASQLRISELYYQDILQQGRQSFRSALAATAVGLAFFVTAIGVGFATNRANASLISALGGTVVEVIAGLNFWLYAKVARQLDAFHIRLERMQRFLLANSVAQSLAGPDQAKAVSQLVTTISTSAVEKQDDHLSVIDPAVNGHVAFTEQK